MTGDKIAMDVMGISYSQIKQDAHALILKQHDGDMNIVVVIGVPEANSIFATLNGLVTPRPMTHDLMVSMFHAFDISLDQVLIYSFDSGVYKSRMTLATTDRKVEIESRTSDAVALALRTSSPIFVTPQVLDKAGFVLKDGEGGKVPSKAKRNLGDMSLDELRERLSKAVEEEKYEVAASIQKVINSKLGNEPKSEDVE